MNNASHLQAQKIIIDLQQNSGGLAALAFALFDSV
jgi:C-terminal processing protease CtpA/Prc